MSDEMNLCDGLLMAKKNPATINAAGSISDGNSFSLPTHQSPLGIKCAYHSAITRALLKIQLLYLFA